MGLAPIPDHLKWNDMSARDAIDVRRLFLEINKMLQVFGGMANDDASHRLIEVHAQKFLDTLKDRQAIYDSKVTVVRAGPVAMATVYIQPVRSVEHFQVMRPIWTTERPTIATRSWRTKGESNA